MKILILGGYGVFGGRLARMLIEDGHDVVIAGRNLDKARAFSDRYGGRPAYLDAQKPKALQALLKIETPWAVVDAAGPFQNYGDDPYRVARTALEAGSHYLDLSGDGTFTEGIAELDKQAHKLGLVALSGVSSVPALSSAAVSDLRKGIDCIAVISTAILPGNRAPRGRSVMSSILGQSGAPMQIWRGAEWTKATGWSGSTTVNLEPGLRRPAAFIGAPDLMLFPKAFGASSVLFRAGLELKVLHYGLATLAKLRKRGVLPNLTRFTRPMLWLARQFESFGTDRGGMQVTISGRSSKDGRPRTNQWTLIAEAGDGPFVPAIAAVVILNRVANGAIVPGARPCMSEFTLDEAETALSRLSIRTEKTSDPAPRLFETALGDRWQTLAPELRALHDVWDITTAKGEARVTRARNPLARMIAIAFGFPPSAENVPVTVRMERIGTTERWTRNFDGSVFNSSLSSGANGQLRERFGPVTVEMEPVVKNGTLGLVLHRGWCLGIPLPRAFLPRSDVTESGNDGRFHFDITVSLPGLGLLVGYKGWLALPSDPLEQHRRIAL